MLRLRTTGLSSLTASASTAGLGSAALLATDCRSGRSERRRRRNLGNCCGSLLFFTLAKITTHICVYGCIFLLNALGADLGEEVGAEDADGEDHHDERDHKVNE